jgi:phage FluMu gp28-like protein
MEAFLRRLAPVWRPHAGQREFLLAEAPIKVLACGRRWGKTDACAAALLRQLLNGKPARCIIVGPTMNQARIMFDRVAELLHALLEHEGAEVKPRLRETPYPRLELGEHRLVARSGHVPRSLRGHEATHIVVDEAAFLPETVVHDVLMPMLAVTQGSMTLVSTPRGRGYFWRLFAAGRSNGEGVWSRQAPTSESPHVRPEFLAMQRSLLSRRAYEVEYEAAFLDATGSVFRQDAVQECLEAEPEDLGGPYLVGVDWARYGDFTAVAVLSGNRERAALLRVERFQGGSWERLVGQVAEVVRSVPHARVLCDATGAGDPVLESLQNALPGNAVSGYTFSAKSKRELIDNLAWLVDNRALRLPADPELLRELEYFEAVETAGGAKLAARGGYHDDVVVALALAGWGLRTRSGGRISSAGRRA